MTKPNKLTENYTEVFGQFFDWTGGKNTPGALLWGNRDSRYYDMLIDQNNPKLKSGGYRPGGNWLAYQRHIHNDGEDHDYWRVNIGKAYAGRFYVKSTADGSNEKFSSGELNSFFTQTMEKGAEAWNAMRPDKPDFSAATSLVELRELVPSLREALIGIILKVNPFFRKTRRRRLGLSELGEYHLAVQFGYLPVLSDIRNFVEAHQNKHKRLAQLVRDNGRPVKRRRDISSPPTVEYHTDTLHSNPNNPYMLPSLVTQCYQGGATSRTWVDIDTTYKTWAFGTFRYILPKTPNGVMKKRVLRRIMGGRIAPTTLYNLMPWSWLIDYFTDLGQFVEAVSDGVADRLWADNAYVMRTVTRTRQIRCRQAVYFGKTTPGRTEATRTIVDKVMIRVKASPFGFGFSEEDLSLRQAGILGALGFSRLP